MVQHLKLPGLRLELPDKKGFGRDKSTAKSLLHSGQGEQIRIVAIRTRILALRSAAIISQDCSQAVKK